MTKKPKPKLIGSYTKPIDLSRQGSARFENGNTSTFVQIVEAAEYQDRGLKEAQANIARLNAKRPEAIEANQERGRENEAALDTALGTLAREHKTILQRGAVTNEWVCTMLLKHPTHFPGGKCPFSESTLKTKEIGPALSRLRKKYDGQN